MVGHAIRLQQLGVSEPPETLRQYAFLGDGERGAIIGPRGAIVFLCAPRWHDDAVFAGLIGGSGGYAVTPRSSRFVWGGHYEKDSLVWRSRWVAGDKEIECREALAFPGDPETVVLLRRVEAVRGRAELEVRLDCRAGFGSEPMDLRRRSVACWDGHTGDLWLRWSGAPQDARRDSEGAPVHGTVVLEEGQSHDLVLEISRRRPEGPPPDPATAWERTAEAWRAAVPDLSASVAPGDSHHSWAVLRGLTGGSGAMVAAATTSLPERAEAGRDYDYRYAWIRDQCYAGQAAAAIGDDHLLDAAVRFVSGRVLEHGADLRPAYTCTGEDVPDQRRLDLPGYPGAPVRVGNRAFKQFQLDAFGESLLLLAAADRQGRLDSHGWSAVERLVDAIRERGGQPDAGIWEIDDRRWAHSRLACAAGVRAVAERHPTRGPELTAMADQIVASVDGDCLHPSGRWQRSPDDAEVDAALLLPGIRGAVPPDDPRHLRTIEAVIAELADDGYVYRFCHDPSRPLHDAEGAFVLCGFLMSLACVGTGRREEALRWFERNRGSLGPPGLFAEEYDVVQRQLRGNLPQAFVHALLLETARRLHDAGGPTAGFTASGR